MAWNVCQKFLCFASVCTPFVLVCTATFFWLCAIAIAFIINIIQIWRCRRSICVVHHSSWCSYHSIRSALRIYGIKLLDTSTTSVFNRILIPITETFALFFLLTLSVVCFALASVFSHANTLKNHFFNVPEVCRQKKKTKKNMVPTFTADQTKSKKLQ